MKRKWFLIIAFGILAARCLKVFLWLTLTFSITYRWRIFQHPIIAEPNSVTAFTKAAIALHNYLRTEESGAYCPAGFADGKDGSGNVLSGSWREEEQSTGLTPLGSVGGNRYISITHELIHSHHINLFIYCQAFMVCW